MLQAPVFEGLPFDPVSFRSNDTVLPSAVGRYPSALCGPTLLERLRHPSMKTVPTPSLVRNPG